MAGTPIYYRWTVATTLWLTGDPGAGMTAWRSRVIHAAVGATIETFVDQNIGDVFEGGWRLILVKNHMSAQ